MRAVRITAPHTIELCTIPDPVPGPLDVVVAVAATGICGTDLLIADGGVAPSLPLVPGHEFAGHVVALGAQVRMLQVGDRVAADPNMPCLQCRYCHAGRFNLCLQYSAIGVTQAGAAAELVVLPAHLCVRLSDEVDLVDAALIEPLSCAVHAFDLLGLQTGRSMAIYGSGTMGLMMLQLAQRSGVRSVDMIDVNPLKLVAARELGCSRTAGSSSDLDPGEGWDVVVDATGVAAAIQDGLDHVARGGTFLQFGVAAPEATVTINPYRIYEDEISIIGAVCPLHSFERSAELLASGAISPGALISHRMPLESYAEAIETFASGHTRKVMVLP